MAPQQTGTANNALKSKRIAVNAMALFLRMIGIMVVNLYAVRIVLHALGEEDYGIFNAVAGVVLFSTFISSTLAVSIQRFYSFALGKQQTEKLKEIFSVSMNIILLISLSVVLLLELIGPWLIQTQLTIPESRLLAAHIVFQCSLFTIVCSFVQLPYTAAIFANEDMGIYALISFLECVARLAVACLIGYAAFDNLSFYGIGLLVVAVGILATYAIIARRHYSECRYQKVRQQGLYKELLSFSGWTMYGTVAGISMIQGTTILLNIFFGPLANAAYAISNQIYNAANTLCHSIVLAFRPTMVKAYAEHDYPFLDKLFTASNKFILYLLMAVSLPLIAELRTIFHWWLGTVSEETVLFSRLFLLYMLFLALNNPITTIIQATGHVKSYFLKVDTLTIMCVPLTWLLFRMGLPSWTAFASMISLCFVAHIVRLVLLRRQYPPFSYSAYILQLLLPGIAIAAVSTIGTLLLHHAIGHEVLRFLSVGVLSPLLVTALVFLFGTTAAERKMIFQFIRKQRKA